MLGDEGGKDAESACDDAFLKKIEATMLTQARARRQRQVATAKRVGVTRPDATRLCCLSVRMMLGAQTCAPSVCVTRRALHGMLTFERSLPWDRFAVHAVAHGPWCVDHTAGARDRPGDDRQGRVRHIAGVAKK